jgi:tetratricopeptide (TPR) repeat protein
MSDACVKHVELAWKVKTTIANQYFNDGIYDLALMGYLEALARAEVLNSNGSQNLKFIPLVQIMVISYTNLSNTYLELKDYKSARNMYTRTVCFLLSTLYSKGKSKENTKNIDSAFRNVFLSYSAFLKQIGKETKNDVLLNQIKKIVDSEFI